MSRQCFDPRVERVEDFMARQGAPLVLEAGREPEELGWVIEHGPRDQPMYLTGRAAWSSSLSKAIRFARERDADDFIREWLGNPQGLRVTELAQCTTLGEQS